jgi:hypothetical protein
MTPGATGPFSKAALLANLPLTQQPAAKACIEGRANKLLPVYVIADRCVCVCVCIRRDAALDIFCMFVGITTNRAVEA